MLDRSALAALRILAPRHRRVKPGQASSRILNRWIPSSGSKGKSSSIGTPGNETRGKVNWRLERVDDLGSVATGSLHGAAISYLMKFS